jgi:hypothetical protein
MRDSDFWLPDDEFSRRVFQPSGKSVPVRAVFIVLDLRKLKPRRSVESACKKLITEHLRAQDPAAVATVCFHDTYLVLSSFPNLAAASEYGARLRDFLIQRTGSPAWRTAAILLDKSSLHLPKDVFWERASACSEVMEHPLNRIEAGWANLMLISLVPFSGLPAFAHAVNEARGLWEQGRVDEAGFRIFEGFPASTERVRWVAALLELALPLLAASYMPFQRCLEIAADPNHWKLAHDCFSDLRRLVLVPRKQLPKDPHFLAVQSLAELVAKVTFNESLEFAIFDRDTGWAVLPIFKRIVDGAKADFARKAETALFPANSAALFA